VVSPRASDAALADDAYIGRDHRYTSAEHRAWTCDLRRHTATSERLIFRGSVVVRGVVRDAIRSAAISALARMNAASKTLALRVPSQQRGRDQKRRPDTAQRRQQRRGVGRFAKRWRLRRRQLAPRWARCLPGQRAPTTDATSAKPFFLSWSRALVCQGEAVASGGSSQNRTENLTRMKTAQTRDLAS
jgi:hypothetical protein